MVSIVAVHPLSRCFSRVHGVPPKPDAPALNDAELIKRQIGAPRYNQRDAGQPKVFVEQFPFEITHDDLRRGQERYTVYCAVCHGPLGNGQGKIWERGYLIPTSFHTRIRSALLRESRMWPS